VGVQLKEWRRLVFVVVGPVRLLNNNSIKKWAIKYLFPNQREKKPRQSKVRK